jgi:hypothetical protein
LPGLAEEKRAGRKRSIDQRRIVAETLRPPPASLGVDVSGGLCKHFEGSEH